jgi:hypothetical protein
VRLHAQRSEQSLRIHPDQGQSNMKILYRICPCPDLPLQDRGRGKSL